MPRLTDATRAERKVQISEAAVRCVARSGYTATSMADIVAESGLSPGSIYSHFDGKAELFRYAIDRVMGERVALLRAELSADADAASPASVLARLLGVVGTLDGDHAAAMMQLWSEIGREPELRDVVGASIARLRVTVADALLPWASRVGSPRDARERAERTAALLLSTGQGFKMQQLIGAAPGPADVVAGLADIVAGAGATR